MKQRTISLPLFKPETAQYLAGKSISENKTVLAVLIEAADRKAEQTIKQKQNKKTA